MGISRKSRSALKSNTKILLSQLDQLTTDDNETKLEHINTSTDKSSGASVCTGTTELTKQKKKKPGRPRGPSLINTARLLSI